MSQQCRVSNYHWRHSWFCMRHNTVGVLVEVTVGLRGCHTSSVGVLQHPTAPGVVNFPTEENPVKGHLTRGEQVAPWVAIRSFRNNVPRWDNPFVHHLWELHVSERKKELIKEMAGFKERNDLLRVESHCWPAVLIEGHDEALVLNAGNRGVVAVFARKNLFWAVLLLATDVSVFRPVEPEQRHHHLACKLSISYTNRYESKGGSFEDRTRRRAGRRGDDEWLVAPHTRPDSITVCCWRQSPSFLIDIQQFCANHDIWSERILVFIGL